jgi:hypothetical protein
MKSPARQRPTSATVRACAHDPFPRRVALGHRPTAGSVVDGSRQGAGLSTQPPRAKSSLVAPAEVARGGSLFGFLISHWLPLLEVTSAMNGLSYRSPVRRAKVRAWGRDPFAADLPLAASLFWVLSLVRVVGAFARHETFGAEATLALMAVLCIPPLLVRRERRAPAPGTKEVLSP